MSSVLHAAVVGVGHLGGFHAQKYASLADKGVKLAALIDPQMETRAAKLKQLAGVRWFASVDEWLLAEKRGEVPKADLASVATITQQHADVGLRLLREGKHLLVEKPLAHSLREGEELVKEAEQRGLVLATGQVERHRVVEVYKALQGRPYFIECHRLSPFPARSTDIDVILDLMIHDIDLMLAMVNSPLESVQAAGFPVLTPQVDIANARFEFANGCVANLTCSRISVQRTRKFRIFSGDSYLSLDLAAGNYEQFRKEPGETDPAKAISHASGNLHVEDALQAEILDFVNAVREKRAPLVTGADGLRAMHVAERVRDDIQQRLKKMGT